ncbi:MAG: hypothetical protein KAR11_03785 [Phycisphaerae bacterium]|nr:hypothetical protein [Phycisphaerae bacterium]
MAFENRSFHGIEFLAAVYKKLFAADNALELRGNWIRSRLRKFQFPLLLSGNKRRAIEVGMFAACSAFWGKEGTRQ